MPRSHSFVYSLVISATATAFAAVVLPAIASESAAEGIKAFRMGDYQRAEQLYRQALSEENDNAQKAAIYRNLSILYNAQGKDGSEFAKKADELNPPEKPAYLQGKFHPSKNNGQSSDLFYGAPPYSGSLINSGLNRSAIGEGPAANSTNSPSSPSNPAPDSRANASRATNPSDSGQILNGASVYGESVSQSSGFGLNRGGLGFGGGFSRNALNGTFGGMSNGVASGYAGAPYAGMNNNAPGGILRGPGPGSVYGGGYYSPGNVFEYSNATPMVLPYRNGAVILNAPGPNVYSSRQAPDGSSTTIIMRTE